MNSETFLIEEADLECAKKLCKNIDDAARNRIAANIIGAKLATKYFEDIEVDVQSGLHNICKILKDYEISDIYVKGNYIDVRLYFNENEICVPKSHFDNNMLPSAYMFIKVNSNMTGGTVTGFSIPSEIDLTNKIDGYYSLKEEDLISFYDVESQLIANYENDYPEEFETQVFDFLDDRLDNKDTFFETLFKSSEARVKLYNAYKANEILSIVPIPETINSEAETTPLDTVEELPELETEEVSLLESEDTEEVFDLAEDLSEEEVSLSDSLDEISDNSEVNELELLPSEDILLEEESNDLDESSDFSLEENDALDLGLEESLEESSVEEFDSIDDAPELEIGFAPEEDLSRFSDEDIAPITNDDEPEEEFTIRMASDYDYSESIVYPSQNEDTTEQQKTENSDTEEFTIRMVSDYDYTKYEESQEEEKETTLVQDEKVALAIENQSEAVQDDSIEEHLEEEIEITFAEEDLSSEEPQAATSIDANLEIDIPSEENTEVIEELKEEDLEKEFSTNVTPSMNSIEDVAEGNQTDNIAEEGDNTQEIDDLFNQDEAEDNTLAKQYNKQSKKGNKFIPLVVVLAIAAGVGYFSYTKFFNNQLPENDFTDLERQSSVTPKQQNTKQAKIEDAMPIETVENVKTETVTNEGNTVSIPAIEQNLNASIVVSNLAVNWEVPAGYVSNSTAKRYFNKMGKIIQLNLKTELLLLSKPPITNKIAVELEFNKASQKFEIKDFVASSGENSIDDVIRTTVNKALNLNLNMNMNTLGNIPGNPVLIIKL